ncbi:MAG TPA: MFS transporter [Propionibacteriaceae bacterium]|nr:MFS transporter [Propionibacteriaceae bacterium]
MTPRHWMVVIGSGLLMSLNVLTFLGMGLLLPPMARTLDVTLGAVMVFTSINALSGAVVMSVAGPYLIRRLGVRRLIILTGVLSGVALFCVSYVTGLPGLYVAAFAAGCLMPLSTQMGGAVLINEWFMTRRGTMLGIVMSTASLGGVLAGTVLPSVVTSGGWELGFRLVGITNLVVCTVTGVFLVRGRPAYVNLRAYGAAADDAAHAEVGRTRGSAAAAFRSPQFVALTTGLILFSTLMAMQQHFPPLMREHGLDVEAAGTLLAVLSVANVAATLLFGALNDRVGPLRSAILAWALLIVSLTVFVLTSGYVPQAVAIVVYSVPAIASPIITPIVYRHTFGDRHLVALLGVGIATMPTGVAIGAPLWGMVKDSTGSYTLGIWTAMALTLVSLGLIAYALVTGPRRWIEKPGTEQVTVGST